MPKGDFQRNKTHCKHGHEYTDSNTKYNAKGHRVCIACKDNYKETNKEKIRKYQRDWKRANKNGTEEYNNYMAEWRRTNPDRVKELNKIARERNPQKHRDYQHQYYRDNREQELVKAWIKHIKREYNLSGREYNALLEEQNGSCAICDSVPDGKRLSVDHNHETGQVRGLLCDKCNFLIGLAKENTSIILKAISYLQNAKKLSIEYQDVVPLHPLTRLNPSIPVEVVENNLNIPTGNGYAIGWIDYSEEHNLLWIVILNDNRQCWQVPNPFIRAQSNSSLGRK